MRLALDWRFNAFDATASDACGPGRIEAIMPGEFEREGKITPRPGPEPVPGSPDVPGAPIEEPTREPPVRDPAIRKAPLEDPPPDEPSRRDPPVEPPEPGDPPKKIEA